MEFYGYETSKFVTIRGRDVTVEFDGTYTDKYMPAWIDPEIRVFKDIFNEGITGNAQRLPLNDTTYKIYNCRLMLLPVAEEKCDIINKIGDVALVEGIAALDQVNGSVKLPNITEKFTTGKGIFTAHGLLETTGGIFRDLTTLQRSENIEITRAGNKYSASASIQMSTAELHFSNYKLSYGIIKLDGEFDIRVAGVKLQAAASIDYSQKPCLPRIEKIKVSELGKVDVAFTGLGIFNSVLGTVVDGIIRFLKVLLTRLLEEELMKMAGDAFKDFDCEKFRPG
ncbi:uncharacterized protein [Fopius arisanus]|uniref:Uncharacterized protein n=1 Tax=Fopius arisanus TaxID=64838 RepID=A0A9R1TG45_9HYME|nr:PREDICTED: uncharacterized protein LOC105269688 [Fopius arisanus]